eukprot:630609-Prymnesium_polylepis.1
MRWTMESPANTVEVLFGRTVGANVLPSQPSQTLHSSCRPSARPAKDRMSQLGSAAQCVRTEAGSLLVWPRRSQESITRMCAARTPRQPRAPDMPDDRAE